MTKLFNKKKQYEVIEQAVVIHFLYGDKDLAPLYALCNELQKSIESSKVGEFDGHEISVDLSDGFLYMYGPDADELFQTILPIIHKTPFLNGASVKLRYGLPQDGVEEKLIKVTF